MNGLYLKNVPPDLKTGIQILKPFLPIVGSAKAGHLVTFDLARTHGRAASGASDQPPRGPKSEFRVELNKAGEILIHYGKPIHAYRALGILAAKIKLGKALEAFREEEQFQLSAIMLDVSRNAAPKPEVLKEWLARFALMGLNGLTLYTETNYEIPGENFWGYHEGRYSIKDLKELSEHAAKLGIEMFPCIQTLAHLKRALHWDVYGKIKDTETVLMVGKDETYKLIEKMIQAAGKPYTSKRIHIGMDEAWDLGLGNYLKQNGYTSPHEMINGHLKRVLDIVQKEGLKPMMWADMYFRAGSKTGAYYDKETVISEETRRAIPKNVTYVYWDYYHFHKEDYRYWIDRHQKLFGTDLAMAPGAQTWSRFWTYYDGAMNTCGAAFAACKESKVKECLMTIWGDDGNECDSLSWFPVLQFYAEHAYNREIDDDEWREHLAGTCDIRYEDFETAGTLDAPPGLEYKGLLNNVSKFLLWEDPLFGLYQAVVESYPLKKHFEGIAKNLGAVLARKKPGAHGHRLGVPESVAKILAVKADLPTRIYKAYHSKNKKALQDILKKDLPFLKKEFRSLRDLHRKIWLETFYAHGWETLENRYGGMLLRLETTELRLKEYCAGRTPKLDELEEKRLKIFDLAKGHLPMRGHFVGYTGTPSPLNWSVG